jgi:O-antigen/teichoic acid export membrane protein
LFFKSLLIVTMGGALFAAATALLGEPLVRLIYGAEYAARMDVFWWLLLCMVISFPVWLVDAAISSARRFLVQLPIVALAVAACTVACTVWVPEHGLVGAAWSMCLALAITLVLKGLVLLQVLRADGAD